MLSQAEVTGYPGIRGWWEHPEPIEASLRTALHSPAVAGNADRLVSAGGDPTGEPDSCNILCMSGGGPGGAFGAGLLCGWTKAGTRPQFRIVTGISSGAILAPFAFLGPEYDDLLSTLCARISTRDIIRPRPLVALAFGADSLADSGPLAHLLEQTVTDEIVAAVAREHAKGRRLLIGTTHLDAGRLVVWDMGAIASCPRPDAPALFRKVILASASIPIAMPAQYFQVEADGRTYDEIHVDGGVIAEMFLYGVALDAHALWRNVTASAARPPRLYLIRNGYLRSPIHATLPGLMSIGDRAIYSFLDGKATGDVYHVHALAQRDGLDFNLAYVPENFVLEKKEPFDPQVMRHLFALGYDLAHNGYPWQKSPPGLDQPDNNSPPMLTDPQPKGQHVNAGLLSSREPT